MKVVTLVTSGKRPPTNDPTANIPANVSNSNTQFGILFNEKQLVDLLNECWVAGPAYRPTFAAIAEKLERL